jgi:hypothetical protein
VRRAEIAEDKLRKETRTKDRLARQGNDSRVYRLTLDTVDKPDLQLIMFPGKIAAADKKVSPEAAGDADSDIPDGGDGTKEPALDPTRDEALNILADLVDLSRGPKTASATTAPTPPQ